MPRGCQPAHEQPLTARSRGNPTRGHTQRRLGRTTNISSQDTKRTPPQPSGLSSAQDTSAASRGKQHRDRRLQPALGSNVQFELCTGFFGRATTDYDARGNGRRLCPDSGKEPFGYPKHEE